jgi:arylsulfatase A-like enzyme
VNWWNTYPPEAVNGVIVSDHVLPAEIAGRRRLTGSESAKRGPVTHPADWMERVTDALKDGRALTSVEDPFRADGADGLPDFVDRGKLSRQYRADQSVTRIALAAEQELRPDLLMVFLPGIDRVSHMLWGAIEAESDYEGPPLTDEERRAAAQALYRYYEFTDGLIGSLVERYGDDDLVLVVSDHGFESGSTLDNTTGVHITRKALHGVIFARGRGIATPSEGRLPRILDVTPTVLAWLGLPVGEDMDGRVATFLHGVEVQRIASHDTSTVERPGALPSGAEEQILEDLRALGYFEEPADE